jgi:photosystem II stability/assembly factor-like uncharacterized protein
MRITFRHLAAAAVIAMAAAPAQAAFSRVSASAGEVRDFLATSSTAMLAGTQGGGLYRTTDGGANWTWVSSFPGRYVWKLVQSPAASARIYAATQTGIYKSTDTGNTWTQITHDPTRALAISPGSTAGNDTLLAGVTGGGLYRSTDSGATWARQGLAAFYAASGLDPVGIAYASATSVFAIFNCNANDFRSNNFEAFGGVFQSTDSGANWASIQQIGGGFTIPTKCLRGLAVSNTSAPAGVTVLVGTWKAAGDGKIHRSFNGGAWNDPATIQDGYWFDLNQILVDRNSVNTFWGSTRTFGAVKSTTAGQAGGWSQAFTTQTEVIAVGTFPSSTTVMVALAGQGVVRSTTGAAPWTTPAGLLADRVRGLANHPNVAASTYYMGVERGGFFRSTNAGTSWTAINTGLGDGGSGGGAGTGNVIQDITSVAAHPSSTAVVYAHVRPRSLLPGGVYSYNTGTTTWSAAFTGAFPAHNHETSSLAVKSDGTTFYAGFLPGVQGGGLYKGASAAGLASVGYPLDIYETPAVVAPGAYRVRQSSGNANLVLLLMYDSLPYRSTNGGTSWARVVAGEASASFMRTAFFEAAEKPGSSGAVWVASSTKGLYRTVDSGANWSRLSNTGLASTGLQAMAYSANGILWVGDRAGRVFCSPNDGVSFTEVTLSGLPPAAMLEAVLMNSQVHFLTDGGGVYKNLNSTTCP